MFKVEILSNEVFTSGGNFEGREWKKRIQRAYMFFEGIKYPSEFNLRLPESTNQSYSPGIYVFGQENIKVVKNDLVIAKYPVLHSATR